MPLYLANRKIFQQFQQKGSVSFHYLLMSSVMLRKPLWCKQKNKAGAPGPGRRVILLLSLGHVPNQNAWAEIGGVYPRDKQGAASRSRSEHWVVRSKQRMRRWTLFLYLREWSVQRPRVTVQERRHFSKSRLSQPLSSPLSSLSSQAVVSSWFSALSGPSSLCFQGSSFPLCLLWKVGTTKFCPWGSSSISKQLSTCSVYTASSSGPQPSLGPTPIAYE